jgi:hypothetical protein
MLPADYGGAIGVIAKPYSVDGILEVLHYLHEGLRGPPPSRSLPTSLSLSARYVHEWHNCSVSQNEQPSVVGRG